MHRREKAMAKRPKAVHQLTAAQFEHMFPDEDACRAYLVARRWPEGVRCPRCGNPAVYDLPSRQWHWQCTKCAPGGSTGYRFSHLAGTIFENTNKPLRDWFRVAHLMLTSKKGMSALQIMRFMGFGSYKTAWLMCHKIRTALIEDIEKLGGIVEVDETVVGGKDGNRHADKKEHAKGRTAPSKTIVVGAVKRKGNVVARVVDNVRISTLESFIKETVSTTVSLLCPDNFTGYHRLRWKHRFPRQVINHSDGHHAREGVVSAIHTNTIDGFWSLIKRGIVGSYHKVSKKYLHLYVAEFQFRYNNRENADTFATAISGC
jgi:transposase-like protein